MNNTTSFTYDVYGNKLTETKPNGAVYRYEYDNMDRLLERQNPDGTKETSTYKPNGLLETSTNVDGSITYFKYDALNRLTEQQL